MFSKTIKKLPKTVGFRLALWYMAVFIVSVVLLFTLGYLLLSNSLRKQDRLAVQIKSKELSELLQTEGVEALEREVRMTRKFKRPDAFFIRLAGRDNRTFFLLLPYQWAEFDIKDWEARSWRAEETWFVLPAKDRNYGLEIVSIPLDDYLLQVGKSTEERQKVLLSFRKLFSVGVAPLLLFGLGTGLFLGRRALRPVRQLTQAFRAIADGRLDARVTDPKSGDELAELVQLFNRMMTRIEILIAGMHATLDNVAHDLRTPMTRLRGIAEMALNARPDLEKSREALADALEESERILAMLNTLMDISEAETGAMKLEFQFVDLSRLVREVLDLYEFTAEEKNVRLDAQVAQGLGLQVDPIRLRQVLANLVDNAVKYTNPGGGVTVRGRVEGNEIAIEVEDTGIGIASAEIPKIWERLYRGDQSRSQKGLGLGLSLVKAVVNAHQGRVEVTSELGKGSCFRIYLPQ
ncbi:MAG: sensor histidine kinase [Desulfobacteraceae bacterium]|nr:MAG: sensor histidine kinase [Desulfobacteraceae bacterium]